MMQLLKALNQWLRFDDAVAGVRDFCASRIWPIIAPENTTYPYLVYSVVGVTIERSNTALISDALVNFAFACGGDALAEAQTAIDLLCYALDNAAINLDPDDWNVTRRILDVRRMSGPFAVYAPDGSGYTVTVDYRFTFG